MTTRSATFPIEGMMCAVCAGTVEKTISALGGIDEAAVNFATSSLTVTWNPAEITPVQMAEAIAAAGYRMITEEDSAKAYEEHEQEEDRLYRRMKTHMIFSWVITIPLCVLCMLHIHFPGSDWVEMLMALLVMIVSGRRFYTAGFRNLLNRHPTMDSLVAVSTAVSFLISLFNTIFPEYFKSVGLESGLYYEGAAMIIAFVLTGKTLETRARRNTGNSLRALMGLQPSTATLRLENGMSREVEVSSLKPGDIVEIHPGERIPVDGIVSDGHSVIDESMLTGEPVGVEKTAGDKVKAGTLNTTGAVSVTVTGVGATTELAHIIESVRKAQGSKAPVQKLVDRIASVFVPTVIACSLLTFVIWIIYGGLSIALLTSVSVLVIACPCALGLATPTAVIVGIGRGAQKGILIRDAQALEELSKIEILAIDKTGTLTEGKPKVTDCLTLNGGNDDDLKAISSLERHSEHPLASAICSYIGGTIADTPEFKNIPGIGVKSDNGYWAGSLRMAAMMESEITEDASNTISGWEEEGAGIVSAGKDNRILFLFKVSDGLRPDAHSTIEKLHSKGIEVVLLTGDRTSTARHIADMAGISIVEAEIMPEQKQEAIRRLQRTGKKVAMAGDGINDAAALAAADVSIAMGTGSDIAIETAMLTLTGGRLQSIPDAIALSGKTLKVIKENLFWAFIYNIIGIPLAAGALYPSLGWLLNPMIASAAMALSSVCVVLNSIRK